jgi:hypothetical protein
MVASFQTLSLSLKAVPKMFSWDSSWEKIHEGIREEKNKGSHSQIISENVAVNRILLSKIAPNQFHICVWSWIPSTSGLMFQDIAFVSHLPVGRWCRRGEGYSQLGIETWGHSWELCVRLSLSNTLCQTCFPFTCWGIVNWNLKSALVPAPLHFL